MEFTDALYRMMDREIPILTAEIRALYAIPHWGNRYTSEIWSRPNR